MKQIKSKKIFDITSPEIIIFDKNNNILKTLKNVDLSSKIVKIFDKIKTSEDTTFEIKEAESIMNDLLYKQIKASSNNKADIEAEIYDRITQTIKPLGFSVK